MNILTGIANRSRRLLAVAAVVATVGMVAIHAKPASADTRINFYKPDLVTSMTDVDYNNQGWMKIVVKNQGFAPAGAFQVAVTDEHGTLLQTFSVSGLAAGYSTTLWHKLPMFDCGDSYTRIAVADSGNVISELNESNNTAQALFIYPVC